jgi:hypothetical protein
LAPCEERRHSRGASARKLTSRAELAVAVAVPDAFRRAHDDHFTFSQTQNDGSRRDETYVRGDEQTREKKSGQKLGFPSPPGANLGGVLARKKLRHAVEDAVGAPVRAHAQARWPRARATAHESEEPIRKPSSNGRSEAGGRREGGREGGEGEGRHRGTIGAARSGGGAG